jgi:hypothetical protein
MRKRLVLLDLEGTVGTDVDIVYLHIASYDRVNTGDKV